MLLTAAVTRAELTSLVDALTPLRISLDGGRGRSITLGRPRLELVPSTPQTQRGGIRLRGDARIMWDVAGVAIPVTLNAWQVLLVPRVASLGDSRVLSLEPVIEVLDLKRVPGFLDGKIAKAIQDGIAQNRGKLAWEFSKKLSKHLSLPAKIGGGSFAMTATGGAALVTEDEVKITIELEAVVQRSRVFDPDLAPRSSRRAPQRALGGSSAPPSERRAEVR